MNNKPDYKKLLDFYWDLFYKTTISEEAVTKKYGHEINEYLKKEGNGFLYVNYRRNEKKFEIGLNILQRISEVENKLDNLQRDNLQRKQTRANNIMTVATVIMAIATIATVYIAYKTYELNDNVAETTLKILQKQIGLYEKEIEVQTSQKVSFSIELNNTFAYNLGEFPTINHTKLMIDPKIVFKIGNSGQTTFEVNKIISSALCANDILNYKFKDEWYNTNKNEQVILKSGDGDKRIERSFYIGYLNQSSEKFPCVITFQLITNAVTINKSITVE